MQREQEIDVKYFKFVTEFYNNQKSGHVRELSEAILIM